MFTSDSAPPSSSAPADPVPAELRAIVALFTTELAKVTFPDVDAAVLRRHVDAVATQAKEVDQARAALAKVHDELERRVAELAAIAARGLAYARIYAAAHPERGALATAIDDLDDARASSLSAPASEPAPRRGRRPKPRPELPLLGDDGAPATPL